MESSTPAKTPRIFDEPRYFEQSLVDTPKPQACSTVNRRQYAKSTPPNRKVELQQSAQSPYLSSVIDGMRQMTDQLDIMQGQSTNDKITPTSLILSLRKAASTATLSDNCQGSIMTDFDAHSSLGILKLDTLQGFSEYENDIDVDKIMEKFRKEYCSKFGKENVQPEANMDIHLSGNEQKSALLTRDLESIKNTGFLQLKAETAETVQPQNSLQADLRLRLQKALAQRTIDRSTNSVRVSQLSNTIDTHGISMNSKCESSYANQSKDDVQSPCSGSLSTSSHSFASNATFGATNFISFGSSPAVADSFSCESFQPAELAMGRLKEDENSWMKQFADLPAVPQASSFDNGIPPNDIRHPKLRQQNLDFSNLSEVIAGDGAASSRFPEKIDEKQLSIGEYFKLHSEALDDERPNFGTSIRSPAKTRLHPPLVNLSPVSGDLYCNNESTHDAGLDLASGKSFANAQNTSSSVTSEFVKCELEDPASRSIDLMPPPPAPCRKDVQGIPEHWAMGKSMSSSQSNSLSYPLDLNVFHVNDLNASSISLDAREKLASVSQIMSAFQFSDTPKSRWELADEFLSRCGVQSQLTETLTKNEVLQEHQSLSQIPATGTNSLLQNRTQHPQSPKRRVAEWISSYLPPTDNFKNPVSKLQQCSVPINCDNFGWQSVNYQKSDKQSVQSQGSRSHSSHSKCSKSSGSIRTGKSVKHACSSVESESSSRSAVSECKPTCRKEPRSQSACSSSTSGRSSSRKTVASAPLLIDSTHTQLSWSSVSPGSSVTRTFTLRNKAAMRVRLLISSPNSAFKLIGEHGKALTEFPFTLHAEETRRIHVVFTPLSVGPVVGKLVIQRVSGGDCVAANLKERRLIALFGYGGIAELVIEGTFKDRWAQLFLNMQAGNTDTHSAAFDVSSTSEAAEVVAFFSVRNRGKVPVFICLQIASELPFPDCCVYVNPKEILLSPGEVGQVVVRFDPSKDVLLWLSENADNMQVLANVWLSFSELATWQRIRRLYTKHYKIETIGPLSLWGPLYSGELGVGHELKDDMSAEISLAQAVHRQKVLVLIEREKLCLFDMETTMIFKLLEANSLDKSGNHESPMLAGMANHCLNGKPLPTKTEDTSST